MQSQVQSKNTKRQKQTHKQKSEITKTIKNKKYEANTEQNTQIQNYVKTQQAHKCKNN